MGNLLLGQDAQQTDLLDQIKGQSFHRCYADEIERETVVMEDLKKTAGFFAESRGISLSKAKRTVKFYYEQAGVL